MARRKLSTEEVKSIKNHMVKSMRKGNIFVPYGVAGQTKLPRTPDDIPESMITYKNKIYMAAYKSHWKKTSTAASAQSNYVVGSVKKPVTLNTSMKKYKDVARTGRVTNKTVTINCGKTQIIIVNDVITINQIG